MKYKIGDRVKMTESMGGYDFSGEPITGYVTVVNVTPHYYECLVEGSKEKDSLCFYESELLPAEEEEKKEDTMKYKVGDVVKMNDKHPYRFDYWDVDGTMTIKEVEPWGLYACEVHGYPHDVTSLLNFHPEWIEGYAAEKEEEFNPGDIVLIKGDDEDYTYHLDGKRGIVTEVRDEDCTVAVYNDILKGLLNWEIWKENMTKS